MASASIPVPVITVDHAGSALNLPDTRDCYRVRIPVMLRLPPVKLSNDGGGIKTSLVDISRVGAAVLAPLDAPLQKGNSLRCEIDLPDIQLQVDAEVRSAVALKQHLRVGLRFANLSLMQRHRIENTVAALERTALRNLHPARKPSPRV